MIVIMSWPSLSKFYSPTYPNHWSKKKYYYRRTKMASSLLLKCCSMWAFSKFKKERYIVTHPPLRNWKNNVLFFWNSNYYTCEPAQHYKKQSQIIKKKRARKLKFPENQNIKKSTKRLDKILKWAPNIRVKTITVSTPLLLMSCDSAKSYYIEGLRAFESACDC